MGDFLFPTLHILVMLGCFTTMYITFESWKVVLGFFSKTKRGYQKAWAQNQTWRQSTAGTRSPTSVYLSYIHSFPFPSFFGHTVWHAGSSFPPPGIEPVPLAVGSEHGFLTTRLPEKSPPFPFHVRMTSVTPNPVPDRQEFL